MSLIYSSVYLFIKYFQFSIIQSALHNSTSMHGIYGKCSKLSYTYFFLLYYTMLAIKAGNYKILVREASGENPDKTFFSQIFVCTVCLGLLDWQLVFELLEHLP